MTPPSAHAHAHTNAHGPHPKACFGIGELRALCASVGDRRRKAPTGEVDEEGLLLAAAKELLLPKLAGGSAANA